MNAGEELAKLALVAVDEEIAKKEAWKNEAIQKIESISDFSERVFAQLKPSAEIGKTSGYLHVSEFISDVDAGWKTEIFRDPLSKIGLTLSGHRMNNGLINDNYSQLIVKWTD